ncbi:hypothetical protein [Parvibaculum sp.]|jgi:PIN domain nuclease of toxin-antitoxin system|uniref:hypothetical protein n=1 Tax=Parvibaculum sp. TaxID=2024848 RepID=UPI002FD9C1EB
MFTLRTFLNRIRTSSAAGRAELKARASRALEDIRRAHQRIAAEAKMLDRHVESELRYKAALTRIDARLVCLTDALAAAETTGDAAIGKLARATAQWTLRKRACEAELNLVRKRINTARHGWAKIEKDAKQLGQWLRDALAGARPAWAEAVRRMSEKLTGAMAAERKRVAAMMTKSALLYDGRDLSAPLAQLRRQMAGGEMRLLPGAHAGAPLSQGT